MYEDIKSLQWCWFTKGKKEAGNKKKESEISMKKERVMVMCVVALASVATLVGCARESELEPAEGEGVAERAGAAVDRAVEKTKDASATAVEKTKDAAKAAAAATKETTGKVVEKTGEALEKAGDAVENAGANMQDATTDK